MRATIVCLLALTVLGCDTFTNKKERDKSADQDDDDDDRPKRDKKGGGSADTSSPSASERPDRDISKLASFTLGTKYSFVQFWSIMEEVTKDKKHSVERDRVLSEAKLNSDYLGIAAPTLPGGEYLKHVAKMAKSLRDKHGKAREMLFLTGARLYDLNAAIGIKGDTSPYFSDLDRSLPQTEISAAVWKPLYDKLKTNFEKGDIDKLAKAITEELKK